MAEECATPPVPPPEGALVSNLRVGLLNIQGGLKRKAEGLVEAARARNLDTVILTEHHCKAGLFREMPGYDLLCLKRTEVGECNRSWFGGLGILYRSPAVKWAGNKQYTDRVAVMKLEFNKWPGVVLHLLMAYAPTESAGRPEDFIAFDEALRKAHNDIKDELFLVAGDFNVVVDGGLGYHSSAFPVYSEEAPTSERGLELLHWVRDHEMVVLNSVKPVPRDERVTWSHPKTKKGSMKDLFLASRNLLPLFYQCRSRKDLGTVRSDHRLVVLELRPGSARKSAKPTLRARPPASKRRRVDDGVEHLSNQLLKKGAQRRLFVKLLRETRDAMGENVNSLEGLKQLITDSCLELHKKYLVKDNESEPPNAEESVEGADAAEKENRSGKWKIKSVERLPANIYDVVVDSHLQASSWERPSVEELGDKPPTEVFKLRLRPCREAIESAYGNEDLRRKLQKGFEKLEERAKSEFALSWAEIMNRAQKNHETGLVFQGKRALLLGLRTPSSDEFVSRRARKDAELPSKFRECLQGVFRKRTDLCRFDSDPFPVPIKAAERFSEPLKEKEIEDAIKRLKSNKAPGRNGIRAEHLKVGAPIIVKPLTRVFNQYWPNAGQDKVELPREWIDADVVPLYKGKGARSDPNNFRGIWLLDVIGKVFSSCLVARVTEIVDPLLGESQFGFRANLSAAHAIVTVRNAQHAARLFDANLYGLFVDLTKAFDSPPREAIWQSLSSFGVPPQLVTLLAALNDLPQALVKGTTRPISVERGVRQGSKEGPLLFNCFLRFSQKVLEARFPAISFLFGGRGPLSLTREEEEACGAQVEGENWRDSTLEGEDQSISTLKPETKQKAELKELFYADDMVFLSTDRSGQELNSVLEWLEKVLGRLGVKVSVKKTKALQLSGLGEEPRLELNGEEIQWVESFTYLGSEISRSGGSASAIKRQISLARKRLNRLHPLWRLKCLKLEVRRQLVELLVLPIAFYGAETWSTTKALEVELDILLNDCRRRILGVGRLNMDWESGKGEVIGVDALAKAGLQNARWYIASRRVPFLSHLGTAGAPAYPSKTLTMLFSGRQKKSGRVKQEILKVNQRDVEWIAKTLGKTPAEVKAILGEASAVNRRSGKKAAKRLLDEVKNLPPTPPPLLQLERNCLVPCTFQNCSGMFFDNKTRNQHEREFHQEPVTQQYKAFTCDQSNCYRSFTSRGRLNAHTKTFHPNALKALSEHSEP